VQLAEGRFEPRAVRLGARADDYIEITQGVKAGEAVVVTANFLIDAESNLKAALSGFQAAPGAAVEPQAITASAVSHRAEGTVESIDAKANTISLAHGPVPTLKWPAMTMEFRLPNAALAAGVKTGSKITFEFVERAPGEYVITKIDPPPSGKGPAGHSGH